MPGLHPILAPSGGPDTASSLRAAALVLLMNLAAFGAALAQTPGRDQILAGERLYTSFDIAVDVRARSAAEARQLAIAEGERRAFKRLLKKIVASDDIDRVRTPGARELRSLLRGFEVADERSSRTRYLASLTFTFEPEKIRAFLGRQRIPFSDSIPSPLLVLPVLRRGGAYLLWEEGNAWRQAWADSDTANRLMDLRFAEGGFSDQLAVTGHQAYRGTPEHRLRELAAKYDAGDVLVVVAEYGLDPANGQPMVYFAHRRASGGGFERGQIRGRMKDGKDVLLRRAADAVMTRLDLDWKARTLTHFGESRRLKIALHLAGIEDWISYRARLNEVPLVRGLTVERLALPVSQITIRFVGGTGQLRLALRQVDLSLLETAEGWVLRELTGGAGDRPEG